MALGSPLTPHDWQTVCSAIDTADGTWNNPGNISRAEQHYLEILPLVSNVSYRFGRESADVPNVDPIIVVYGKGSDGTWRRLETSSGDTALTLTTDTTNDLIDGSYTYSEKVTVQTEGMGTLLACIKTAYSVSSGNANNAWLEALPEITYQG